MINSSELTSIIDTKLKALRERFPEIDDTEFIEKFTSNIDHIAYIVQSSEKYNQVTREWLENGYKECFTDFAGGEDEQTGTKVGVYRMPKPIKLGDSMVDIIEIIMPNIEKRTNSKAFEFDHFEISIGDMKFEDFIKLHPDVKWNTSKIARDKYPHLFVDGIDGFKFVQGGILS
jgi:predicted metalloenzyme YecM